MERESLGDLVQRAQDGDAAAAGELVKRYEVRVRAAIHHRLGPELRAKVETDDLYQSAISAALKDLRGLDYEGEKAFLGWLRTIAERRIRMAARHHRAAKRDVRRERALDDAVEAVSRRTTPSQAAVRGEVTEGVRKAVAALPDLERRVVELHSFEGLSLREVAEQLGLSGKKAAHDAFRRALRKMADEL